MPKFTAPVTDDDRLYGRAFALAIEAPRARIDDRPPWMNAIIVPAIDRCEISRTLAQEFAPDVKEGDVLTLTLVEECPETSVTHYWRMGMPVHLLGGSRPDIVRISIPHLLTMFDIEQVMPQPGESREAEHLILRLRPCVAFGPTDEPDEMLQVE